MTPWRNGKAIYHLIIYHFVICYLIIETFYYLKI